MEPIKPGVVDGEFRELSPGDIFKDINSVNQLAADLNAKIDNKIIADEKYIPALKGVSHTSSEQQRISGELNQLRLDKDKNFKLRENLNRLDYYLRNAKTVEDQRDKLIRENKSQGEIRDFEEKNIPAEARGRIILPPEGERNDVEKAYGEKVDAWIDAATAAQDKARAEIAEENLPANEKAWRQKEKDYQRQIRDLERRVREANQARDAAIAQRAAGEIKKEQLSTPPEVEEPILETEQRLAEAEQINEDVQQRLDANDAQSAAEKEASERHARRILWWASAVAGGGVGIAAELTGQGWWLNPILRGATTAGGLTLFAADIGVAVAERRAGRDLEDRLGRFRNVAKTLRTVLSGAGAGIAAVSLSTMAVHAAPEGIGALGQALTERFTEKAPEKVAKWVPEKTAQWVENTDWLSKINIYKDSSAWGTVHDMVSSHQVPGVELWQAPTGNNSADVIAQWSTEIFPEFNNSSVDVIQPGTLDLTKHLQPDQVDFLKKLAGTKDYNQYVALVKEFAKTHPDIARVPEVARVLARK